MISVSLIISTLLQRNFSPDLGAMVIAGVIFEMLGIAANMNRN